MYRYVPLGTVGAFLPGQFSKHCREDQVKNVRLPMNVSSMVTEYRHTVRSPHYIMVISVADPDPGSGAFFTLDPDPGWVKKSRSGSGRSETIFWIKIPKFFDAFMLQWQFLSVNLLLNLSPVIPNCSAMLSKLWYQNLRWSISQIMTKWLLYVIAFSHSSNHRHPWRLNFRSVSPNMKAVSQLWPVT